MKTSWTAAAQAILLLALSVPCVAQQPPPVPPPPPTQNGQPPQAARPTTPLVPLKIDVVLVKYAGDRKVSSTPYSLSVNTGTGKSSIRMGAEVPVPVTSFADAQTADGRAMPQGQRTVQYRAVGTSIDCFAQAGPDQRYRLNVTIEDTSVYPSNSDMPTVAGAPTFRTFSASNELFLRDGQTAEFVAATDKVSGEVIKAEVTLTVVK